MTETQTYQHVERKSLVCGLPATSVSGCLHHKPLTGTINKNSLFSKSSLLAGPRVRFLFFYEVSRLSDGNVGLFAFSRSKSNCLQIDEQSGRIILLSSMMIITAQKRKQNANKSETVRTYRKICYAFLLH